MRTICILLAMAGIAWGGEDVVMTEVNTSASVRFIPQDVLQGIKDHAVLFYPGSPKLQEEFITNGIEAFFELASVPDNPLKRDAAINYPFDYSKQLYLALRGV